uniref:Uncharacterized protein TCIL3000_10_230 n=1 Tax=Trypanosoma congolense (strain IL3000) TaxID=1068625 RepID=G0UV50_TRYCI|nr:unnamed protein product [Trypanosoma congolense IL3000]
MEAESSDAGPSSEEMRELMENTCLSESQIFRLYERFTALDRGGKGCISHSDLQSLSSKPLLCRVLTVMNTRGGGEISFVEFAKAFSVFLPDANEKDKLRFAFSIYDIDGDGKISNRDLNDALKLMTGPNMTDVQLQQIVDKTFIEVDFDNDGYITFADFEKLTPLIGPPDPYVLEF